MKKSFKQKSNMAITTLLIIGIAAVVNFFSYQIFFRWDLTENKDYSISSVTKNTLRSLDDIVNVKVYFSKNLPNQFLALRQNVEDILDGYANYSNGKIRVEYIDPADDPEAAKSLYLIGIPELQFEVYEKDQLQLVKGYLGMAIQYGDKTETLPVVRDTKSLEYQITLAIKKVTSSERNVIALLTSHGVKTAEEIETFKQSLEELYDIYDLDLTKEEAVFKEAKALLIIGPKEKFSEEELKKIDQYVMGGGALLVAYDGVKIDNNLQASDNKTDLEGLLAAYGLKVNNDLVLEAKESSAIASFNQGFFTFSTQYPFWPKVIKDGFDGNNSAVAKLENITLPWVSSIDIDESKLGENPSVSRLVQTSEKSWKQSGSYNLNPQQIFTPSGAKGKATVAALVEAGFTSPYGQENLERSKIILLGDSDFISSRMAQADNLLLAQNLVDSLSLDSDLIEIRSKGVTDRPIQPDLSEGKKNMLRYGNVFGMTVAVIAFGLIRYYLRRRSRFADEL